MKYLLPLILLLSTSAAHAGACRQFVVDYMDRQGGSGNEVMVFAQLKPTGPKGSPQGRTKVKIEGHDPVQLNMGLDEKGTNGQPGWFFELSGTVIKSKIHFDVQDGHCVAKRIDVQGKSALPVASCPPVSTFARPRPKQGPQKALDAWEFGTMCDFVARYKAAPAKVIVPAESVAPGSEGGSGAAR